MSKIFDFVKPGVVTGDDVQKIFKVAKENKFALPAVNCVGTDSINAVLEAAAKVKAPVIVQFSNGGAAFIAGKGFKTDKPQGAAIFGAISGAHHVHLMAEQYGVPVYPAYRPLRQETAAVDRRSAGRGRRALQENR